MTLRPPAPHTPDDASAGGGPAGVAPVVPTEAYSHGHPVFWASAGLVLVLSLYAFREILLPFVLGLALAYVFNPLADALERRQVNRTLAAALIVSVSALVLVGLMIVLVPLIAEQGRQLSQSLPNDLQKLRAELEPWAQRTFGTHAPQIKLAMEKGLSDVGGSVMGGLASMISAVLGRGVQLINVVSLLLITPLVVFYLLVDWHTMLGAIARWLPRDQAPTIIRLARTIDVRTAAFFRGQGVICLLLGSFYALGLTWTGIDYGALIGFMTGILSFVPFVGWLLGLAAALILGVMKFGLATNALALIIAVFVVGQILDTAVLSPKLVGARLGLHPVWLIFALFAFSYLLGFTGTLIAVPLAAATGVLLRHGLDLYLKSDVYLGRSRSSGL